MVDGEYNDVYDGNIWKEFLDYKGKPFLSLPFNFAFSLNVDWFQHFKHIQYAEGAVYLTILNLPCQERYLQENVMLLGVIPGPKEPRHINSLLEPFVKEMMSLWTGVIMNTAQGVQTLEEYFCVVAVMCLLPGRCVVSLLIMRIKDVQDVYYHFRW